MDKAAVRGGKKKKARNGSPPPAPLAMKAGAGLSSLVSFSSDLEDSLLSAMTAPNRTKFITGVLRIAKSSANKFRVGFESKSGDSATLWNMLLECASLAKCAAARDIDEDDKEDAVRDAREMEVLKLARRNLTAKLHHDSFVAAVEASSQSLDDPADGLECMICYDSFSVENLVMCGGDATTHFFCKGCFRRYATETVSFGSHTNVPCADQKCTSFIPPALCKSCLSDWEILRMDDREEARNHRVCLAAKAVLSCKCGVVAVIDDVSNKLVTCPGAGCGLQYCVECANAWHSGLCPPPSETLKWLSKRTKACPNCRTPIEKNDGCDHMYCAPPGGCGHHFNWSQAVGGAP